jgi:hypothetical protein
MNELLKSKTTLVIVGGIIVGLAAWYVFSGTDEPVGLVRSETVGGGAVGVEERAILDTLFQLRAIQLSGTIFNNPTFTTLRDFRTDIVAEPIGRRNPFAPLGTIETQEEIPSEQVEN